MRRKSSVCMLLVALGLLTGCEGMKSRDLVVARVGDIAITRNDLIKELEQLREIQQLIDSPQAPPTSAPVVLDRADLLGVEQSLVLDAALRRELKRLGGSVTSEDRAEANKTLESQISEAGGVQLPEAYRASLIDRLAHEQAVFRANGLDTASLEAQYERNKDKYTVPCSHHILVDTEAEAEAAQVRLLGGTAFEDLAKEISKDGSSANGGDLGCMDPANFVPEFAAALESLAPGELSGVVKTDFGFHIIRRDNDGTLPKEQVVSQLLQEGISPIQERLQKDIQFANGWDLTTVSETFPLAIDPPPTVPQVPLTVNPAP